MKQSGMGLPLTISSMIHLLFFLPIVFFYGYSENDIGIGKGSMFVEVIPMPIQAEATNKDTLPLHEYKAGSEAPSGKKEVTVEPQKTSAEKSFEGMKEMGNDEIVETSYKEVSTLTGAPDFKVDSKDVQSENMQLHPSNETADIYGSGSGERADKLIDHTAPYGTGFSGGKEDPQTGSFAPLVIKPEYPRISRERGEEGNVILQVEMSSGGGADIKVIKSSGYTRLDKAAVNALEKGFLIFIKASGVAAYNKTVSVNFRIEGWE